MVFTMSENKPTNEDLMNALNTLAKGASSFFKDNLDTAKDKITKKRDELQEQINEEYNSEMFENYKNEVERASHKGSTGFLTDPVLNIYDGIKKNNKDYVYTPQARYMLSQVRDVILPLIEKSSPNSYLLVRYTKDGLKVELSEDGANAYSRLILYAILDYFDKYGNDDKGISRLCDMQNLTTALMMSVQDMNKSIKTKKDSSSSDYATNDSIEDTLKKATSNDNHSASIDLDMNHLSPKERKLLDALGEMFSSDEKNK